MNAPLTTDQRQQVAQAWRQSSQAQQMPPTQVEQFAQQILGGQADVQVQQYVSQNQAQQITMAGGSGAFSLQTPFGAIQIPGMPNLQIPGIQPMQFSGLPQLPTMTPMSPPQLPGMPMMPPMSPQQQTMPGTSMFDLQSRRPGHAAVLAAICALPWRICQPPEYQPVWPKR